MLSREARGNAIRWRELRYQVTQRAAMNGLMVQTGDNARKRREHRRNMARQNTK